MSTDAAFDRGRDLAAQRDFQGAEAAFREADAGGSAGGAAALGVLLESRRDVAGAADAYVRADERGDGLGAFRLGLLLARQGDWERANEAFARADERGVTEPGFDAEEVLRAGQGGPASGEPAGVARPAFANPVLVGAITVLVVVVAVFLAYTANRGLPFVPTKELKVQIANGSDLVVGNDVREGGFLIGLISDMQPIELPSGQVGAQLTLKLSEGHSRVPVDSTATILPRSVLGTKFVQLNVGTSRQLISDGGTLPLSHTSVPQGLDDLFSTFDPKTRTAIQQDLAGYGDTLTGRGGALNDTIANLPALLGHLQPVARYLSDPHTGLTRFLTSLNTFMGAISPVAATNARLFTDMASTFQAISHSPSDLQNTIAQTPPTLDVSTDSLRAQQPFLTDLATLGTALTPATQALDQALPQINPALETGAQVLPRTPALNARLQNVLSALKDLATAPGTNTAINALTATVDTLNPMLRYLAPYQTVCDDWNYFWTGFADHVSEQTQFGEAQRVLLNFANHQPNNVGTLPAWQPANGYAPLPDQADAEYLHVGNYVPAIDSRGFADCESGQRGYELRLNHADPLHRNLVTDSNIPGDQGPLFAGRPRVPAGETFRGTGS